jgi:hypothetical protein
MQLLLVRHEIFNGLGNSKKAVDNEAAEDDDDGLEEKSETDAVEESGSNRDHSESYISYSLRILSAEVIGCLTEFTTRSATLQKAPLSIVFYLQVCSASSARTPS